MINLFGIGNQKKKEQDKLLSDFRVKVACSLKMDDRLECYFTILESVYKIRNSNDYEKFPKEIQQALVDICSIFIKCQNSYCEFLDCKKENFVIRMPKLGSNPAWEYSISAWQQRLEKNGNEEIHISLSNPNFLAIGEPPTWRSVVYGEADRLTNDIISKLKNAKMLD